MYVADEGGTDVRRLVGGLSPAWSWDGSRLAFHRLGDANRPGGIYVVDADGSHERWLASGENPTWAPGDREIAYADDGSIFVIAADGSTAPRLLVATDADLPVAEWASGDAVATGENAQPLWSPDGRSIAFLRFDPYAWDYGGDGNTYVVDADGSGARVLGGWCTIRPPGQGQLPCPVLQVGWSPDGISITATTFEFDDDTGGIEWVLASIGEGGWDQRRILLQGYGGHPRWSPDGSRLAYESFPTSERSVTRIFVLSDSATGVRQLVPEAVNSRRPDYSDFDFEWRRLDGDPCYGCWDY